jgi:CRISPR-associated protein Cmr1
MTMPERLEAKFKIVTPVFCAGADQKSRSEIRPFSLRGALRFWYRAVDGEFHKNERAHFGHAAGDQGQASPVRLSLPGIVLGETQYGKLFNAKNARASGAAYLGYTLYLGPNERKAVPPEHEPFTVELVARWKEVTEETRRAWLAALWLLGHLGGLGTRSRRGLGTIALWEWSGWPEAETLQPAHGAASPQDWMRRLDAGLKTIFQWFPAHSPREHEHQVLTRPPILRLLSKGQKSWEDALDCAGALLRDFRANGKRHEDLVAFGLPLKFSSPPPRGERATGERSGRSASRLHLRIIRIGERYHPLFLVLDAPLLPGNERVKLDRDRLPSPPGLGLIQDFMKSLPDALTSNARP